jgi:hypothetical protein
VWWIVEEELELAILASNQREFQERKERVSLEEGESRERGDRIEGEERDQDGGGFVSLQLVL